MDSRFWCGLESERIIYKKELYVNHGFEMSIRPTGFLKFWFVYNVH